VPGLLAAAAVGAGLGYGLGGLGGVSDADALAADFLGLVRPRQAIQVFAARHAAAPEEPLARAGLALAHFQEAQKLLQNQKYAEAILALERAIRVEAGVDHFHIELADALASEGQIPQAIDACREAQRLNPESTGANLRCFHLLLRDGRAAEAVPILDRLAALAPRPPGMEDALPRLYRMLGDAFEGEGDAQAAAANRRRADDLESR